jgi:predicted branched-subunit amino acid permease
MACESETLGAAAAPSETAPLAAERSAVRSGVLTMLPLLVAFIPFALVIGSAAADHGDVLAGWTGSWLILGGSAHLAAIRTIDSAGVLAAIFTGLLINARLIVFSTSLARSWVDQPRWFRLTAAALIIDPTWAVGQRHAAECSNLREQRRYFTAAALTLAIGWCATIAVGAILGARLDWLDLQIAIPLCLLALLGPGLRDRSARSVILVAAVVALVTTHWPSGTGLLAAVVCGCCAGLAHTKRVER